MKRAELEALKEACRLATPGPWHTDPQSYGDPGTDNHWFGVFDNENHVTHGYRYHRYLVASCPMELDDDQQVDQAKYDTAFIAVARNLIPEMIEEIEGCWRRIDRLTEMVDNGEKF